MINFAWANPTNGIREHGEQMSDTELLEFYVREVAGENSQGENRLMLSRETGKDDEIVRPTPVWFWENDSSDCEFESFREAIEAMMETRAAEPEAK